MDKIVEVMYIFFIWLPIAKVGDPGNLQFQRFFGLEKGKRDIFSQHIDISVLKLEILCFWGLKI